MNETESKNSISEFDSKYRVQCKIGEGSFSEVLKCQDRSSGHSIAAKRLKKHFNSANEAVDIPEVIVLKKLPPHPNILQMIDWHFDPVKGQLSLIFELMEMSLYDLLKSRKRCLAETRVKNYLYQILKGLEHLHSHGIFHRDIKPENILVKKDVIKLADLGSIRGIFSRQPYTEYISTRWYRSPECLLTTGYYGPKMDVWSVGCVFYELLTSKPLFPGANEIDQLAKIHSVLGSPNSRILAKFSRHKSRNNDVCFPSCIGSGMHMLLPFTSESGRDLLKMMLVYDPDARSNVRRLLDHRYFNDLRESLSILKQYAARQTITTKDWRNPVLLSFIATERKRKSKRTEPKHKAGTLQKTVSQQISKSPTKTLPAKTIVATKSWVPGGIAKSRVVRHANKQNLQEGASSCPKKHATFNESSVKKSHESIKKKRMLPVIEKINKTSKYQQPSKIEASSIGILPIINAEHCSLATTTLKHFTNKLSHASKSLRCNILPPIPEIPSQNCK